MRMKFISIAEASGPGKPIAVVRAIGDTDCDGVAALFELPVEMDEYGEPVPGSITEKNEWE